MKLLHVHLGMLCFCSFSESILTSGCSQHKIQHTIASSTTAHAQHHSTSQIVLVSLKIVVQLSRRPVQLCARQRHFRGMHLFTRLGSCSICVAPTAPFSIVRCLLAIVTRTLADQITTTSGRHFLQDAAASTKSQKKKARKRAAAAAAVKAKEAADIEKNGSWRTVNHKQRSRKASPEGLASQKIEATRTLSDSTAAATIPAHPTNPLQHLQVLASPRVPSYTHSRKIESNSKPHSAHQRARWSSPASQAAITQTQPEKVQAWRSMPGSSQALPNSTAAPTNAAGLPADEWPALNPADKCPTNTQLQAQPKSAATAVMANKTAPVATAVQDDACQSLAAIQESAAGTVESVTSTPTAPSATAGCEDFAFANFAYLQSVDDEDLLAAMEESVAAIGMSQNDIDLMLARDEAHACSGMPYTFGDVPNFWGEESTSTTQR